MSTNENNSEVAVDKVGEEKSEAKSDLKGAKRAAEVSAHVNPIYSYNRSPFYRTLL
jgi:hypothetical protein